MSDDTTNEAQARAWWDAWAERFQNEGSHSIAVAFGPGAPEGDDLGLLVTSPGWMRWNSAVAVGSSASRWPNRVRP